MAYFFEEPSHTFDEYLLIPGYTGPDCIPANVSLKTPVVRYNKKNGETCPLTMNIPFTSAVMQSVSDDKLQLHLQKKVEFLLFTVHKQLKIKLQWLQE